jgi:hypothetical protein
MIKTKRMGWAGHVAHIGGSRMNIGLWLESQKETDQWKELDIGGEMILKWILERWDGVIWTGDSGRALMNTVMNLRVS